MLKQSDTQTSTGSTYESPQQRLDRIFRAQQEAFLRNPYPTVKQRKELMNRVPDMLLGNRARILAALDADLGGSAHTEADLLEIIGVIRRAQFNIAHVRRWMKQVAKPIDPITQGNSRAYITYQPKGVVGNMVTWNFPFDIALGPTLDALGAGNRVIIKPSELTPECGRLLTEMIAETFDEDQVAVVTGEVEFAKYFATKPWNHLVYTGGANAGREVMRSAADNLVPVTLELGGRNATIVGRDKATDPTTISVIAGVKTLKRGQMCVTADHCLVPEESLSGFTDALVTHMREAFGADNAAGTCGIVNDRHVARLTALVDQARESGAQVIQIGQEATAGSRLMPFFVVVDPPDDLPLMQQEIFGPILPIKTYRTTREVIDRVNAGDHPLGLYVFSDDRAFIDEITQHTHSGGVAVNAVAIQAGIPSMGFGGVGASGMGRHHGEEGFREFSNPRGYFERGAGGTFDLIIPPYGEGTRQLIHDVAYGPLIKQLRFAVTTLPKNLIARFRRFMNGQPHASAKDPVVPPRLVSQLQRVADYEATIRRTPLTRVLSLVGNTRASAAVYRRTMPRLDIRLARMANGFVTARIGGFPFLILTTTGARTGQPRTQPLMYVRDGPDFVVLGTNFGQPKHPGWTANLRHHPEAVVEVGPETLHVVAAQVGDEEYSTLLPTLVEMYPGFDHYLRRRGSLRARMFRLSPVLMTSDTSGA